MERPNAPLVRPHGSAQPVRERLTSIGVTAIVVLLASPKHFLGPLEQGLTLVKRKPKLAISLLESCRIGVVGLRRHRRF